MPHRIISEKMEVTIDVYKESGKWYTGCTVEGDNLDLREKEFVNFIGDPLPAKIGKGYIVVKDTGKYPGNFHNCLFPYDRFKGKYLRNRV